uniref:Innexin n=1 Tax=Ascaris lumbricoides TaxID=6252 RepID=A0A0M3HRM5_ASCLU
MYLCSTDIIERCNTLCSDPAGDFVDRLSYDYTVRLLVFFAVLVGTKQYFGAPIQCITPSNFPGTWVSYARDYCFVTNTYLLNGTTSHTNAPSHMVVKQGIHYYQWVPFIFILQAFLLVVPRFFWNFVVDLRGVGMRCTVENAMNLRSVGDSWQRNHRLAEIASFSLLDLNYAQTSSKFGRYFRGALLALFYVFSKWLSVIVVIIELLFINHFVGGDTFLWGYHLLRELIANHCCATTAKFPLVTFCDFSVMHLAQPNVHSIQCVLTVNMLNEKIFIFLWFWIACLTIVNAISAIYVSVTLFSPTHRYYRFLRMLKVGSSGWDIREEHILRRFVHGFLKPDGILLFLLVNNQAGGVIACELAWHISGRSTMVLERLDDGALLSAGGANYTGGLGKMALGATETKGYAKLVRPPSIH